MKQKLFPLQNHGMSRDLSISKADPKFAWENCNVRITVNEGDTMLSVTNEKGTAPVSILGDALTGAVLGWNVLGNTIVLFTRNSSDVTNKDKIYRLRYRPEIDDSVIYSNKIYEGNLNFLETNCIESVVSYESETIQKVYWVDGRNPLRSCNFMTTYTYSGSGVDTQFDSTRGIASDSTISVDISKDNGGTTRANGTIQYFITAYNKFGAETCVLYSSPLVYLSPFSNGGSPDGYNQNKVTLRVSGTYNIGFEYIRTYAVIRTSYNGQSSAFIISENAVANASEPTGVVVVTDNGANYVSSVDYSEILLLGSKDFKPYTIQDKDNTLFLGNLTIPTNDFSTLKTYVGNCTAAFDTTTETIFEGNDSLYPYKNQLQYTSAQIKTFKARETYRFGVVFYKDNGEQSPAFWVDDVYNATYPSLTDAGTVTKSRALATISTTVLTEARRLGYNYAQLCMAQATYSDRTVKAQGLLNPTVFNLNNRYNNQPYAMPSWIPRIRNSAIPSLHLSPVKDTINSAAELQCAFYGAHNPTAYYTVYNDSITENTMPAAFSLYQTTSIIDKKYKWVCVVVYMLHNDIVTPVSDHKYYGELWIYGSTKDTSPTVDPFTATPQEKEDEKITSIRYIPLDNGGANKENFTKNCYENITYSTEPAVQECLQLSEADIDTMINSLIGNVPIHYPDSVSWHRNAFDDSFVSSADQFSSWNRQYYFTDDNLITFHSPEIEYERINIDKNTSVQLRIVGVAPITSTIADYNLDVSNARYIGSNVDKTPLSIKKSDSNPSTFRSNCHGVIARPMYYDSTLGYTRLRADPSYESNPLYRDEKDFVSTGSPMYYWTYMWHKTGSMINYRDVNTNTNYSSLDDKRFANLYYSYKTVYQATSYSVPILDRRQVSGASAGLYEVEVQYKNTSNTTDTKTILYGVNVGDTVVMPPRFKYPVYHTTTESVSLANPTYDIGSSDPVSIRYKTGDHVVVSLDSNKVLPYISDSNNRVGYDNLTFSLESGTTKLGWNDSYTMSTSSFSQDKWTLSDSIYYNYGTANTYYAPYLFIAELYVNSVPNRYGGNSETAKQQNVYIPCGPKYKFPSNTSAALSIYGTEGDTYYQRYDCVIASPDGKEDVNQVFNIASVMLETHVNIDGRTDIDRGPSKLTSVDTDNFGKLNTAYDQENNFLSFTPLDDKKYGNTSYPYTVTWGLEKHKTATTDTWLHQTLASTYDLDASNGKIRSLNLYNNKLIAFQDRAISEIIFNPRVQIPTSDGVPIEISNSGKVNGKRDITKNYGCVNKWSIVKGKQGLYFKDDLTKTINVVNDSGLVCLSEKANISEAIKQYCFDSVYDVSTYGNTISFYDNIKSDVYFVNYRDSGAYADDYSCLVYNERLNSFIGKFSYFCVPMMANISSKFLAINGTVLYWMHEGNYNSFFGTSYDSSITWRVCPEPYSDKLWTNLEYRADFTQLSGNISTYKPDITFDSIRVWNEYQDTGTFSASWSGPTSADSYPDIRKKFRIWRADIPRDSKDTRGLNRIRNPWVFLRISKAFTGNLQQTQMELHDMVVKYFTNE